MKNDIWLHGSPKQITQLEPTNPYNMCDYTNSGLGLFLTQNIEVAKSYGEDGYITTVEVDTNQCYVCNYEEFWCTKEPFCEEDIDPMGNYVNLPGSYTRQQFLDLGYTTLLYSDEKMGQVLVVLDNNAIKIINSKPINLFKIDC